MNKSELITKLAISENLDQIHASFVVKIFFESITKALISEDRVEIRVLFCFLIKHYKGYIGRNPKTSLIKKFKSKKLPFFKCGQELKKRVDCSPERGWNNTEILSNYNV